MRESRVRFLKYISIAIILLASALGLQIIVSIVSLDHDITYDFSEDKEFTLSNESINFLKKLDKEVSVVFLSSQLYKTYGKYVKEFNKYTKKVSIKYTDFDLNPTLSKEYTNNNGTLNKESIIVESNTASGKKYKVINQSEFQSQSDEGETQSLQESVIVGAISYVTTLSEINIYRIVGHDEIEFNYFQGLNDFISRRFLNIKDLNLFEKGEVPKDASLIFVAYPKRDFMDQEIATLEKYIESGGQMFVSLDFNVEIPKINALFNKYGINVNNDLVVEKDPTRYANRNMFIPRPFILELDFTKELSSKTDAVVGLQNARSISILKNTPKGVFVKPILETSQLSWGETNIKSLMQNIEPVKEKNDNPGPLYLGVYVSKKVDGKKEAQIIVYGSSTLMMFSNGDNLKLTQNSINALVKNENSLSIPPKTIKDRTYEYSESQMRIMTIIVIALPVLITVLGIVVWLRRRAL